jgi:hypothetical protein
MAKLANNPAGHPHPMNANSNAPQNDASSDRRPGFRVLCAWCEQLLEPATSTAGLTGTSHGICAPCALRHFGLDLESLDVEVVRAA